MHRQATHCEGLKDIHCDITPAELLSHDRRMHLCRYMYMYRSITNHVNEAGNVIGSFCPFSTTR